jgi:voltage-gated potassium channel
MSVLTTILQLAAILIVALVLRQAIGRRRLEQIIFEADTPAGRNFDLGLLIAILLSVVLVVLESDPRLQQRYEAQFNPLELGFTLLFSLEYLLRLLCADQPLRYARSFFGIVDFLSSLPLLVGMGLDRSRYLAVIRILRLLRVFRILKLGSYLREAALLKQALIASRRKILVFLLTIITLVVNIGALMYVIEGPAGGFGSIPLGIYWAIVTITTVGFGDVTPVTTLGRIAASAVMLLGYSIIAVPTGIITAEINQAARAGQTPLEWRNCVVCDEPQHLPGARHCHRCGARLPTEDQGSRSKV